MMINELETMWKEVVVTCLKILPQHLPGGTKENHEKTQVWRVNALTEI
jgi:hypothetical protein